MEPVASSDDHRAPVDRRVVLVVLLLLGVALILLRLRTYHEPLEHNLTTYAVIGHELNLGARLYTDVWDHKPPAIYVTFALAERLAGYGPGQVYLLNILAGLATLGAVFVGASRLPGAGPRAGLWAAALWVGVSGDPALRANQPDTEVFLNACLAWGFALFLTARDDRVVSPRLLGAAGLFALASLFKNNAVLLVAALCAARLLHAWRQGGHRRALAQVALVASVGALAWLSVAGHFALRGRYGDFHEAVVTFNLAYAGSLPGNLLASLLPSALLPPRFAGLLPLLLAPLLGCGLAWRHGARPTSRGALLVLAYALGVWVTVAAPGKFYASYYQLWLPLLVITSAWLLSRAPRGDALLGALLAYVVATQAPAYAWDLPTWCERKYGPTFGQVFATNPTVAAAADALLEPDETLHVWDEGAGLYFYARRRPPARVFWVGKVLGARPDAQQRALATVDDLARRRPELFVQNLALPYPPDHPLVRFLDAHYVDPPTPLSPSPIFRFRVLRGGRLDLGR